MTALKDQWRQQRQQRQHDLVERQRQVRDTLSIFREERSEKAAQMRDDLSLFQLTLQQNVGQFLNDTSEQRQVKATQLLQLLTHFTADLRAETAQFLALTSADRTLMAQQLSHDLSAFRQSLTQSVNALRLVLQAQMQQIGANVQALRTETQILLELQHEERLQRRADVNQELAAFIEALQSNVSIYLSQLEMLRHERADEVHELLHCDRQQRAADMDALFQELSQFRGELKQFCVELKATVWGNGTTAEAVQPSQVVPARKPVYTRGQPFARTLPKSRVKANSGSTIRATSAKSKPEPAKQVDTVATVMVAEPPPAEPTAIAEATISTAPPQTESLAGRDAAQIEKNIFEHIHTVQGARLTEIESALGINRFQAVDALRALIKKGQVTQRDRIYLVQEEVSL